MAVVRMQFAPVISTAENPSLRGQLRKSMPNPPEAVLVGDLPGGWEGFFLLGEIFTLPAERFAPELKVFPEGPDNPEPDFPHLQCTREGARLARMDEPALRLLHEKMTLFWTRQQLNTVEAVGAAVAAGRSVDEIASLLRLSRDEIAEILQHLTEAVSRAAAAVSQPEIPGVSGGC